MSALAALVSADSDLEVDAPVVYRLSGVDVRFESAAGESERSARDARAPATLAVLYPLNRLGLRPLRRPMVVSVERDDADVVMSNSRLRIWGVGDSIYDALEDFSKTFTEVLRSYENTPHDQMTEGAVTYLQELRSYLA